MTRLYRRYALTAAGAALMAACANNQKAALFSTQPDVHFFSPGQWKQQNGVWIYSIG